MALEISHPAYICLRHELLYQRQIRLRTIEVQIQLLILPNRAFSPNGAAICQPGTQIINGQQRSLTVKGHMRLRNSKAPPAAIDHSCTAVY